MEWGCSDTASNNTLSNMAQEWIRSAVMPLTSRYRMDLIYQGIQQIRAKLYMDTLFPKSNSVSGHACSHIFTDGEGFFFIMNFFNKVEVGMALRAFAIQVGISNDLHFDRADDQMGPHINSQCVIR